MSASKWIGLAAVGLLLAACGDEPAPQAAPSGSAAKAATSAKPAASAARAPTATATATAAAATGDDLPTVADFEEEADTQIDTSNMETELSALEKELAEDK